MVIDTILEQLKGMANPRNVEGMARYGIRPAKPLGISMPALVQIAKGNKKNHDLAGQLWASGIHEARILACLVDDPARLTVDQMDRWAQDFDSWDICDQCCIKLFRKSPLARTKAVEWSRRQEEFVKRAGYSLMATLAVHDKQAPDEVFATFLERIETGARDERNFVKKAVNWALRAIGKRGSKWNRKAIATARRIQKQDSESARWIASDALRELLGRVERQ